jgi:tripartite-type tricarboxylate transporter receptor subunit TctC
VLALVMSQSIFGRPFVLPPETPAERVAALRKAFVEALRNKSLLAEGDRMKLDIGPLPGEDLQLLVRHLYATPVHIVERARQALAVKPQR